MCARRGDSWAVFRSRLWTSPIDFAWLYRIINKHKVSNHLIIISVNAIDGGWPNASNYAKYIRGKCAGVDGISQPVQTLLVTDARVNTEVALRHRIRKEFRERKELVYVVSHGTGIRPGFRIGNHRWLSTILPSDPDYNNIYPNGSGMYNDVRKLAASVNFAPTLVWMDNCASAGPYPANATNASTEWMETFKMEYYGHGAFVGNFKNCAMYGFKHCRWDEWRQRFWDFLMVGGNNVQTAYNRNMSITPNDCGAPLGPHDVVQWFGWGQSAF